MDYNSEALRKYEYLMLIFSKHLHEMGCYNSKKIEIRNDKVRVEFSGANWLYEQEDFINGHKWLSDRMRILGGKGQIVAGKINTLVAVLKCSIIIENQDSYQELAKSLKTVNKYNL